jgi:hypothetical protein
MPVREDKKEEQDLEIKASPKEILGLVKYHQERLAYFLSLLD